MALDLVGVAVLLLATAIACNELGLFFATRAAEALRDAERDDRPSSIPPVRR